MLKERKKRRREGHKPGHDAQKPDAHQKRHRKAGIDRAVLLIGGKFFGKNRHEHQIVDAENDFKDDEGEKTGPDCRVEEKVHA